MEPIGRRGLLVLGGLGVAAIAAGAVGVVLTSTSAGPHPGSALRQPELLRSREGVLDVRITAAPTEVEIGGTLVSAFTYNGALPGPTLAVRPGDRVTVTLENRLPTATNLHTHGLHVSPLGAGDNPFTVVSPGETFQYEYQIPKDHPLGTFWYHPHAHGTVADQVAGGLYGAILVQDSTPDPSSRQRVLIISDIGFDDGGTLRDASPSDRMMGREGDRVLINGQLFPRMTAAPDERERWRIVNACTSRYLRLRLDGQHLRLLGMDSSRYSAPPDVDEITLAPGNRADLLVTAVMGTSVLRALPVDRGSAGGMMGGAERTSTGADLALFTVEGAPARSGGPTIAGPVTRDIRTDAVSVRRTLTLAMGMGGMGSGMMSFTIDGKSFDPDRVDIAVSAGAIEEWTLRNTSRMDHPFHLHVWPMQLVDDGARREPSWRDVVNVPARSEVRVRIAFDDVIGRSVYHCHILDHEDNGMMGVVEVT